MTWAFRRQLIYISILVVFFGGMGFIIGYPYFNKPPTCMDGKQNGDERGVDCGGSCVLICSFEVDQISTLWSRSFKIVPGRYNAVAYLENKNENSIVQKMRYRFRFADANNVYIGKREGETFIPTAGKFAIFEPAIDMGNSVPVYTTFEFLEPPIWVKVPAEKVSELKVFVSDIRIEDQDSAPKLSAIIKNQSLFTIPDLYAIVILYDKDGNAITTSRTFIETLGPNATAPLTFTWLLPFGTEVFAREIIPFYNLLEAKLR